MYEIVVLVEHWVDNNMEASYPPTLDKVLQTLCLNLNSEHTKVREKSLDVLLMILDRYPGYRENLEDHFSKEKIEEIEDLIESRKNKGRGNSMEQEAVEIFMQEYQEERERFINFKHKTG
jgi:macrodomain Ter protein organizer (MatP/YcbG family)